jgi:hypothetical protein
MYGPKNAYPLLYVFTQVHFTPTAPPFSCALKIELQVPVADVQG